MHLGNKHQLVRTELVASAILLAVSGLWSVFRGIDLGTALQPTADAVVAGAAVGLGLATMLPLVTARWARRVLVLRGLRRAWNALESGLGPGLGRADIVVLTICSAISEEVFFRGVLQPEIGVVAASVTFGLLHPLGAAYVAWATAAGAGFGMLYLATGSLIAPAIAHGTYNLLALTYLRQRSSRPGELS